MNDPARQPDLTRQRILDAAFGEIHRNGFQAASIANILADTKLTKGALYYHFPTKQALGLAVVEEKVHARLESLVFQPLRDAPRPAQALAELMQRKHDALDEETVKLGCPLNNLMQEMSPIDEQFRTRLSVILIEWQKTVEQALRRGQKQGDIRADVNCRAAALFIVSAFEGCVGVAKNMQSLETFRSCMRQLKDYVCGLTT